MTTETSLPHQLVLDDRRRLSVSGVSDVDSFDDTTVIAHTALGDLTIKGQSLHISRLNTETGDLTMEGQIDLLEYTDPKPRGNTLRRWFR
ncbi:MAG: sporulation protein YabP [Clostridia bacterium]|nr:sporulation protein YabP [Clostridia bacterium]